MKPRRLLAVARKELIHLLRDPRALGISIALPLVLLLLFGYALTLDVDRVPLVVWDQSRTPQSRELVARFEGSRYFQLRDRVDGYPAVESDLDHSEAMMALVIPRDFARKIETEQPVQVQVLVDGSDANTATLVLTYAESVVRNYSQGIAIEQAVRSMGHAPAIALDVRPRAWFNADMESKNYIVPGLIAVIIMLIAALQTSLTVAREWETGTMEQLISTPIRGPELILGKLLPYFAVALLDMILAVLAGRFLFHVPLRGSLPLLMLMSSVYIVGSLSMGILISTKTRNQLLASQVAYMVTFLPAFLLSGFMFDIANMPNVLQYITYVVPARYFVAILRGLYLKGVGVSVLWREGLLLVGFGFLMLALAVKSFKKRLE
jgi:ABC-2 type transport system permease protein